MLQPDYVTVDELKRYLRIPGLYEGSLNTEEDVYDDIILALAITSASRAIDKATNRQFGKLDTATALIYTARYDSLRLRYEVEIDDLMDASEMVVEIDGAAVTDYRKFPFNAATKGIPWTKIIFNSGVSVCTNEGDIEVTAKWGWTEVPDTIKNATLLQAARIFKRRDAPFGVAGSPELGSQLRLLAKLDPDVDVMVKSYKRVWGGV